MHPFPLIGRITASGDSQKTKKPANQVAGFFVLEVTVRIELTKYGFANRPVSHSGTSPRDAQRVIARIEFCQIFVENTLGEPSWRGLRWSGILEE